MKFKTSHSFCLLISLDIGMPTIYTCGWCFLFWISMSTGWIIIPLGKNVTPLKIAPSLDSINRYIVVFEYTYLTRFSAFLFLVLCLVSLGRIINILFYSFVVVSLFCTTTFPSSSPAVIIFSFSTVFEYFTSTPSTCKIIFLFPIVLKSIGLN